jgi:hypothetical protein
MESIVLGDDGRIVVGPRRARRMLDCGATHLYQLLATGELESYLDGRSRKITISSINSYIERRLSSTSRASTSSLRQRGRGRPRTRAARAAAADALDIPAFLRRTAS